MEATVAVHADPPATASKRAPAGWATGDLVSLTRSLATCLAVALLVSAGYLLFRRLSGATVNSPPAGVLLGVGACAALWSTVVRLLTLYAGTARASWRSRIADWGPTLGLVIIGTWATAIGGSVAAAALVWCMIAAAELGAALIRRLPGDIRITADSVKHALPPGIPPGVKIRGADVWQQQTRERAADGREWVHGTLRTGFVAGQRTAVEHLIFSPMLSGVPHVTAAALDELDCTVRATHVYRYGARLEIRLPEPCDEPVEVLVRYEVRG